MLEEATSSEKVLVPTRTCLSEQKKKPWKFISEQCNALLDLSIFNENLHI